MLFVVVDDDVVVDGVVVGGVVVVVGVVVAGGVNIIDVAVTVVGLVDAVVDDACWC